MGKSNSATKKTSGSLWDFIRVEFSRGYSLENDEKEFSDRREKVYTFMKIPLEVERFMFYGFCQCADSFLFVYTFLPLRALVALKALICRSVSKLRTKHKHNCLSAAEACDLLKMAVLISCSLMLMPWDTSMMYHVIKSQSVIKLYIFFNMLEVGDRLFSSFGQDILDALFWTATEPKHSRREHFGVLSHFIIAVFYVFLHSILVLCQATTLNVAINSSQKALLAIMMSNNFVELKGSVFKKFDKTNLFQLSCSDVRERFHLFILLLIVVVQTMKEYQWTSESFWELILDCMYVMISEMLIDWTKHAFITRFNEINLSVYSDYVLSFAYDTAQSRHNKAFTDHSDLVARRMGFIPIPLGVVMIKVLSRCVSFDGRLACMVLLLFTFTCLVTLKVVNLVYILGKACKLIEFHKTSLIKNHHIINGVSCQDMATSPMRPQLRKKQTWSDNKENKPSPLIDVPPLGPTPMFANSNIKEKQYNDVIKIITNMSDRKRNTRPGLSLLAYCYYYTDDFQNASTIYEQLAALWPEETDYKLQHSQSLYSAGRYEDALRAVNGITKSGYENQVRKLTAAIRYGMEDIAGARSLLETTNGLKDDPDTDINYGCLLYKEDRYEEALQKFLNAQTMLGFRPHLSYSIALCYYKLKDFTSALKHIGDIIERGIREHPELGIGMTTEGIEVRSVGNTLTLHESALVEAFNLKAAIQFEKNDINSAREALTDMPPRWEEELDSMTLHNQALCSMDMSPTQGFHKLQFLMQQSTYPQETLQNLLILYCKHGYHDLASDVISTYSPVKDKYLSNYIREFVDAVIAQQTSPDEAYRKLDNMANKLADSLRKATRSVQESREARDDKRAKRALLDYENTLEKFIPVTMAQAKIYWDLENYAQAETIFYKSVEFCNENDTWRLHVAHVLFMQEKFKEAIAFYEPIVKKNYNNILSVSAIVLANLCVSHIMTAQNEEAEELMRKIEKEEERLYYQEPEKKVFHLCIVNLVIGTLYCSKGNYEFGISRVIKSLEPYNKKLGMDTWFYAKRCMLSLIENMTKHIIVMRDSFYNECLVFLNQCEFHGKEVATMPDEEDATGKKELNNVTCEARLLKSLILRQLEY